MIKGLEVFKTFFRDFQDQYVLIGGAACDIVFSEADMPFRATKDFDMVLIVEALTSAFGREFWNFIGEGGYEHRMKSNGKPQFYRFTHPKAPAFPYMIELFARSESIFDNDAHGCRPLRLGDEIPSLSAIMLNNDYYQLLLANKVVLSDLTVLPHTFLILFKAKAWLDLTERKAAGQQIRERDIRKHKADVTRLTSLLTGNETREVPESIRTDMTRFIEAYEENPPDMNTLGLPGVTHKDITEQLRKTYL